MKRFFALIFMALLCISLLCACGNEQTEEISSGESLPPAFDESDKAALEADFELPQLPVPMEKRVFKGPSGKYGLLDENANIIVEPIYRFALAYETCVRFSNPDENGKSHAVMVNYDGEKLCEGYENITLAAENETGTYFAAAVTNGTRLKRVETDERQIYTEEEPNREYWILNYAGEPVFDISFDAFNFVGPDTLNNPEGFRIWAEKDGDYYQYVWNEEYYELEFIEPKGETGDEFFGYKRTCYYWYPHKDFRSYGLNDPEGNVIFEPIYNGLSMPFEDRVILTYSNYSDAVEGERLQDVAGLDGTVFANWNFIWYTFFEDGSWVGIAKSNGEYFRESYNDPTNLKCYDEDGNVRPRGVWFVDKDGQPISERFDELYFLTEDYREDYRPPYPKNPDDAAVAVTASGETVTLSIEEYIRRQ